MEKGYRDFGHDIDNTDDPVSVGLGLRAGARQARRLRRPGRRAGPQGSRSAAPAARAGAAADPEPLLFHAEPVLRDGVVVGYVRAASYGWTLGAAVGLAFVTADEPVTADWLAAGRGRSTSPARHDAEVSLRPMYDPTSARVRE